MQTTFIFNFCGLLCNLTGTILLVIGLSKNLTAIYGALALHDLTLQGLLNKQSDKVFVAEGFDSLLKKGVTAGVTRTRIGLCFIAVGFLLQLVPYVMLVLYR
jgi:hypothetical protein